MGDMGIKPLEICLTQFETDATLELWAYDKSEENPVLYDEPDRLLQILGCERKSRNFGANANLSAGGLGYKMKPLPVKKSIDSNNDPIMSSIIYANVDV
ncbi:MAG: hypothetical protein LBF43_00400 [Puniceicoccales bacterium]|jgi:hypothetical protein|nr:hypothetical protein [Puniceicoccales bacterium]